MSYCIPIGACSEFEWGKENIGFGRFYFYQKDGKVYCNNEMMSKDFIKTMICEMIDNCILED